MQIISRNYQVYPFCELSTDAQNRAISDHIEFWLHIRSYDDEPEKSNFKTAIDKAEAMQTPWFTGSYVYDYCKDEIIDEIELNEYVFTADGKLLND